MKNHVYIPLPKKLDFFKTHDPSVIRIYLDSAWCPDYKNMCFTCVLCDLWKMYIEKIGQWKLKKHVYIPLPEKLDFFSRADP